MRIKPILLSHLKVAMLWGILVALFLSPYSLFAQNVGIGTTTPTARLQINHSSSPTKPGLLLMDSMSPRSGLIRFGNISTTKYMQLWGFYENHFSAGQYLDIVSDSTFVATFRGNGNFGIGVGTPAYPLDVAGVINSSSEYRLNGKPVIRWSDLASGLYRNLIAGDSAGFSNTGFANTFIGGGAGTLNLNGHRNCFVGTQAGYRNVDGNDNTFIGAYAGIYATGSRNTFMGSGAGASDETGINNTFIGSTAGNKNISGTQNTIIGSQAGFYNESGTGNSILGQSAGNDNISGDYNTLLGSFSDVGSPNLINSSAIGYRAYVNQSNSIVLGSINGLNGATADTRVGIGTTAPTEKLEIVGNIKVSGEINNSSTGSANLLPVAFGSISTAGAILSGSSNFTVTRTAAGSYTIDITGHSYGFSTHTTIVTAIAGPFVANTNSSAGNLFVRLYNLSGVLTDGNFHFVVYRQ